MPRPVLPQALVITLAILLVAQGSALAGIGVFTVEPSEPGCDEQMTFHVSFERGCAPPRILERR